MYKNWILDIKNSAFFNRNNIGNGIFDIKKISRIDFSISRNDFSISIISRYQDFIFDIENYIFDIEKSFWSSCVFAYNRTLWRKIRSIDKVYILAHEKSTKLAAKRFCGEMSGTLLFTLFCRLLKSTRRESYRFMEL